jgi:DNA replication protein DnaC
MTEELEQLLKNLKLRRILEIYDEQLRAADKDDISYSDFVTRLVRAQFQAKQEGALEWRIRRANLPERWTLETFPFARQPGVNRKQIRGFAELEFIAKAENIVLVGETGSWQDRISLWPAAEGAGERLPLSVRQGAGSVRRDVCVAGGSLHAAVAQAPGAAGRPLLIDELGYLNLKPEQSNIFFKLMEERYRQHSTIITTNLVYDEWPNFLGNRPMVEALLSRLRHYCHTVRHRRPVAARAARLRTPSWTTAQPGRICSPGSGGVSQNAGHDGDGPPCGPAAGRATLSTRRLRERDRKRIRAGGGAPPDASRRCPALGTIRSLAYFLPVIEEVLGCASARSTSNISATSSNASRQPR